MNLELIESIISEHGVPSSLDDVVRIVNERHGVDVRAIIQPAPTTQRNMNRYSIPAFAYSANIDRAYREYRSSRRHAACQSYLSANILSVYKANSPHGCVYDRQNSLRTYLNDFVNRTHAPGFVSEFPAPLVLDQSTRMDLDPQQIGDEDHIRIQLPLNDLQAPPWRDGNTVELSNGIVYSAAVGNIDTTALVAEGWELVHGIDINTRSNVVIGAVLPESVDPRGRHAIVLRTNNRSSNTHVNMPPIVEVISVLSARWNVAEETPVEEDTSSIDVAAAEGRELMSIINIASSVSVRVTQMAVDLETTRARIPQLENNLARDLRSIDELAQELEILRNNMRTRVIEMARGMFTVVDLVREIRPVASAELDTSNSNVILRFVTHPFAMRYRGNGVVIPRIEYQINMMADSYSRGIDIFSTTDHRYIHPHMGTNPTNGGRRSMEKCWGAAGRRPLPEAWARRDWMSLVRLILAFHTQYNNASPLCSFSVLREHLDATTESGWLVPEPTETSNREMVEA